jgi:predicted tellurium resistance membrane protein TerC
MMRPTLVDDVSKERPMEWLADLWTIENMIALLTLTALEVILGIDNIVFITIVVEKLPEHQQPLGRRVGLGLAMIMRIGLLFIVSWIIKLKTPLFTVFGYEATGHSLILIFGGLFLIAKATWEIREKLEDMSAHIDELNRLHGEGYEKKKSGFWMVITQIVALDLIFSVDSVITAVGMAKNLAVIIIAVMVAVTIMLIFAEVVAKFVSKNPTIKMLALAFLILIGVALVAEGFEAHFPKGYIYTAMGFSLAVELINLKVIKGMVAKRTREQILKRKNAVPDSK